MNPHTALGIAQIIFYIPVAPLVIWLMIRNGKIRPRMAWWPLIPFSLMRPAGGPVIIALENHPNNIGLYVAAIILLNVGVIPLIVATLGLMCIILMDNYQNNPRADRIAGLLRFGFIIAVGLLAAGGGVSSIGTKSAMNLSRALTLGGYVLFAAVLAVLIAMELFFWKKRWTLLPSSREVLRGALLASPFLILRTVYGILQVALENSRTSIWNPVSGKTVAFALMALLPEYIVLGIYLNTGFSIRPRREPVQQKDGQVPDELERAPSSPAAP